MNLLGKQGKLKLFPVSLIQCKGVCCPMAVVLCLPLHLYVPVSGRDIDTSGKIPVATTIKFKKVKNMLYSQRPQKRKLVMEKVMKRFAESLKA